MVHDGRVRPHAVTEVLAARRAAGSGPLDRDDGHRVVLAIEGGGSRATYSSGMVLALEELGLARCFDAVYGASAGALAGSWLVAGQAAQCCAGWWRPGLMDRVTNPARGLRGRPVVDVEYLINTVGEHVVPLRWDAVLAAEVLLHPVATDVETGDPVDLHDEITDPETLKLALRASACVPLLAGLPIEFAGRRLVDAAVAEPIPFHTAVRQDATHVLVLRTRRADQAAIDATRMEKALVSRLGASRVPGLVQVLGSRLEGRRADDGLLARASTDAEGVGVRVDGRDGVHLLEVRPPEDAEGVNPLETDPDRLRRACMVGRAALRAAVPDVPATDRDAEPA